MTPGAVIAAATSWPEAVLGVAGMALVGGVIFVVVWQALATWRARIAVTREEAYRRLAQQTARDLHDLNERIGDRERGVAGETR